MKVSVVFQFLLLSGGQRLFTEAFLSPASRHVTVGKMGGPYIRSPPTVSLAATLPTVPSCAAKQVGKTILVSGAAGIIGQLGLYRLFRRFRIPQPAFRAHSVVALSFVVLLSFYGSIGWWNLPATTAATRLIKTDASARWMGATVVGAMGLWDVPTTVRVKELRKPDVIIHHCMMTLVALVGALQLPTYYAYFYLGVCELSSIPLVLLELCTPAPQQQEQLSTNRLAALQPILTVMTAVSFSIVRAYYFTKVTLRNFIPDIVAVWSGVAMSLGQRQAIRFLLVASLGFTLLQLYWFYTQIVSVVWNGKNNTG